MSCAGGRRAPLQPHLAPLGLHRCGRWAFVASNARAASLGGEGLEVHVTARPTLLRLLDESNVFKAETVEQIPLESVDVAGPCSTSDRNVFETDVLEERAIPRQASTVRDQRAVTEFNTHEVSAVWLLVAVWRDAAHLDPAECVVLHGPGVSLVRFVFEGPRARAFVVSDFTVLHTSSLELDSDVDSEFGLGFSTWFGI